MTTQRPRQPSLGRTSTGLDPRLAAVLAYLIWWVTGLLFVFLERDNRFVRFHAMQAIVGLGAIWVIGIGLWIAGIMMVFISGVNFRVMMRLVEIVWLAGVVAWLICLYKAYTGERWKLPIAGGLAERLAGR